MSGRYQKYDDDDGRVVADMSDVDRQPFLMPRLDQLGKGRRDIGMEPEEPKQPYQQPVTLDREERRAMISGAVSAGLLVAGILAVSFAALILLILKVWG